MRLALALLIALHAVAHLVGFRAAFWPIRVSEQLTRKPSRVEGVSWLLLALAFLVSAGLLLARHPAWLGLLIWIAGTSLALCVVAWPDARIGLALNVLLLGIGLALGSQGERSLRSAFARERAAVSSAVPQVARELVQEETIARLPEPVQRYLRFMEVVGRPRDTSIQAEFRARFRRDGGAWLPCQVLQYTARAPVTRVFVMQLALDDVLPVTVRDNYAAGKGWMEARAFDWFRVAEARGPELDLGELVTYLNDAILMAPSLVLGPETSFTSVDSDSFEVRLRDGSLSVSARVRLDARGAPTSFSTTDRFYEAPGGKRIRSEWRTPVEGWQRASGRPLPTRAQAVWQLDSGPLAYADFTFDPARITFDAP